MVGKMVAAMMGIPSEAWIVLEGLAADMSELEVVPLKGAMTNEVYQIKWNTNNNKDHHQVLLRIYGEGVELFFNRDDELRTFHCMSKHGHGPKLLARFSNGRIEEFINARTLSAADLRDPQISALIASRLRDFHQLDMPGPKIVLLWERLRNWLTTAKTLCTSEEETKEFSLDSLEEEIAHLEQELLCIEQQDHRRVGFCHNDLQYGNIMMDEQTRLLTIIDYEYSSFNPIAYDLANHFCEMAADYHKENPHILDYSKYPDFEERKTFVQIYLSSSGEKPSDVEVEDLIESIDKYALASHLFWCLWGIISGHVNNIDFDYMEYARQRLQQYRLSKDAALISGPRNKTL